jgi:hypothetical protein
MKDAKRRTEMSGYGPVFRLVYLLSKFRRKLAERWYAMVEKRGGLTAFRTIQRQKFLGNGLNNEKGGPEMPFGRSIYLPYLLFSPESAAKGFYFDSKGVPVRSVEDRKAHFNPLFPAYFGLVCWNAWQLSRDQSHMEAAFQMGNILAECVRWEDEKASLEYETDFQRYRLKAPWIAGITQGIAASLFLRLQDDSKDAQWGELAAGLLKAMMAPVSAGGTFRLTPEGLPWLEEYPGTEPSFVLNGFMYSIIALLEYENSNNQSLEISSGEFVDSLLQLFPLYLYPGYLRYSRLYGNFCNMSYRGFHVLLCLHLYMFTDRVAFYRLAELLEEDMRWDQFCFYHHLPKPVEGWGLADIVQLSP